MSWLAQEQDIWAQTLAKTKLSWPVAIAFWSPVMYLNFKYVPFRFQIPFSCMASLLWSNVLILYKAHNLSPRELESVDD